MNPALRDEIVGTVGHWAVRSGLAVGQLLTWLGLRPGKYHAWQARWGLPNRHLTTYQFLMTGQIG